MRRTGLSLAMIARRIARHGRTARNQVYYCNLLVLFVEGQMLPRKKGKKAAAPAWCLSETATRALLRLTQSAMLS